MPRIACCALASSLAMSIALPVHAELGDYTFWQTLAHLTQPPPVDNPVRAEQRVGVYPLPHTSASGFKPAQYWTWQTITLPASSGAVCGDGSPYKIFINRVPNSSNTLLYLEGGGACWDYASCSGAGGMRGARNPNGIPDHYMSLLNPGASLVSPLSVRVHPYDRVKTQNWNIVYMPYCTGDIHAGDKVAVYADPAGRKAPLIWHHNGLRNTRATVSWLKDHLQRAGQLLIAGCSAGGAGSLNNYFHIRRDLQPTMSFLFNDSGAVFNAPLGADPERYPSTLLHRHIRSAWGLDGTSSEAPLNYLRDNLPGFDSANLGSLPVALASAFSGDRMGQVQFWQDLIYSAYSYESFFEYIKNETDKAKREAYIHAKWHQDTAALRDTLSLTDNFGYYLPRYRALLQSHCATVVDFANGDLQESGLELHDFIDDVLNGQGPVMKASETDDSADHNKPFNLLYWLIDRVIETL